MIGQIAILIVLGLFLALCVWWVWLLFYPIYGVIQNLCEKPRFSLRTMLLAMALLQVLFATIAWQQRVGSTAEITMFWLAGVSIVAWLIWVAIADFFVPTASQRWKRVVRSECIRLPEATHRGGHVEPPPRVVQPRGQTTKGE